MSKYATLREHFNDETYLDPIVGYPERSVEWFKEKILPDVLATKERLNLGPKLLDVGCAFGYFSKVYAQYFEEVTGIDFSDVRIPKAIELNSAPNLKYLQIDLTKDSLPEIYDTAISSAVFQHISLSNRRNAFETVAYALNSGSYLVLYDEDYSTRPHNWDDFYEPLKQEWLKKELDGMFELEKVEFVARGNAGEYEYRYELRKV